MQKKLVISAKKIAIGLSLLLIVFSMKAQDYDPLYTAIDNGKLEEVKKLVQNGANIERIKIGGTYTNEGNNSALAVACANGKFAIAHYLLDKGAKPQGSWGDPALWWLAFQLNKGYSPEKTYKLAKRILDLGAHPDYYTRKYNGTPLMCAASNNSMDLVKLFLSYGAKRELVTNKERGNAGDYAERAGHIELANFLRGQSNEAYRKTLIYAVKNKNLEQVKSLVNSKTPYDRIAFINKKEEKSQMTALHYAAKKGAYEIAEFLVQNGADINAQSLAAFTPLHYAATKYNSRIGIMLVKKGANINVVQTNGCATGFTSLSWALQSNLYDLVEVMLESGADLTLPSTNPLITARHGGVKMVKLLITKGGAKPTEEVLRYYNKMSQVSGEKYKKYKYFYDKMRRVKEYLYSLSPNMGASLSNSDMSMPEPSWLGNWNSNLDGSQKVVLTIIEKSNGFTGTYQFKNGKLKAKTAQKDGISYLEGNWMQSDGTGWFRFRLSEDGQNFYGEWGYGTNDSVEGYWNGIRPN